MADLNNLLGEIEDHEEEGGFPSPADDAFPHDDDGPADDGHDDDAAEGIGGRGTSTRRAELPPALAEARRKASAPPRSAVGAAPADGEYGDDYDAIDAAADADADADAIGREDGDGPSSSNADPEYEQLKSIWSQELMSPELLPNDADTVALHVELLRGQEDTIEELREQASSGGGGGGGDADPMLASLAANIYKMEADRVRFLLADLTRTRLAKIENHALYNRDMVDRMSEEEISYLQQYGGLLERHYQRTVLNHLPKEAWRKLDEPEMIDEPDLDAFVFCRILETVEIDNAVGLKKVGSEGEDDADELDGGVVQEHGAGSCLIARYHAVKDFIHRGKVILLM